MNIFSIFGSFGTASSSHESGGGEWTPADIADLSVFLQFNADNCYESNGGAASTVGNPVGYVAPLFGTSISASEATNRPILTADGLDMSTDGSRFLSLSSEIPGNGEFTVYWSAMIKTQGVINFLSHTTATTLLGSGGSGTGIYDENTNGAEVSFDSTRVPSLYLGRYSTDGLNGNFTMDATYGTQVAGAAAYAAYPFNQVGGGGAVGAANDRPDNRLRLLIWVNRHIALDSPEDVLIRNWIRDNDGAELGMPWTPADISNLAAYYQFIYGACQTAVGEGFSNIGDVVGVVSGLYGTPENATESTNKPTLQDNGLQLDAAGVQQLNISTLNNTTDITVYWSMIEASGAYIPVLNSAGLSYVGGFGGDISIWDENGSSMSVANNNPGEIVMGRFSMEESTETYSFIATGSAELTGTIGSPTFSFNKIGGTGGLVSNDNVNNRIRLILWVNRLIVLDSEEDLLIRNWIETFDGATL